MANNTRYTITVPKSVTETLDRESDSLRTTDSESPSWFSGYSLNTIVKDNEICFTTRSNNEGIIERLSQQYPDIIIKVKTTDDFSFTEHVRLWINGEVILHVHEYMVSEPEHQLAWKLADLDNPNDLLTGKWKDLFNNATVLNNDTLVVGIEALGMLSKRFLSYLISVKRDPLTVEIKLLTEFRQMG